MRAVLQASLCVASYYIYYCVHSKVTRQAFALFDILLVFGSHTNLQNTAKSSHYVGMAA